MNMTPALSRHSASPMAPVPSSQINQTEQRPQRAQPLMRRYEVVYLARNGDIVDFSRIAPAAPVFEGAFSAFARGTSIYTPSGQTAVEDLLPGDRIRLAHGGEDTLLWKGSMMVVPLAEPSGVQAQLTRVAADAFGFSRPTNDGVFGPAARLFQRLPNARSEPAKSGVFIPIRDFVDGGSVVPITPISPVEVFHLGLGQHRSILAGGLEVESYHPDPTLRFALRGEMLNLFLSLFPHVHGLEDFGLAAYPRLNLHDLDLLDSA